MTAAGGTSYSYDNNGNQTARGSDTFTWDHENRLTQSVVGGVTSSSVYYGDGVRRSHTVNGVTTTYVYDVGGGLPLVLQDGTNTLVYGLDLISSTDGSGNQTYYSYDGLGSVTDLTNGMGTVTDTYSYDVFGAVRASTGSSAQPWKFTGEQEDGATGDTGYYFLRARYVDTASGRFVSRDPVEFDQRYAYASLNPTRMVDLTGLESDESFCTYTTGTNNRCSFEPDPGPLAGASDLPARALAPVGRALTSVGRVAEYCSQDWRVLPLLGECWERYEMATMGVFAAGTSIAAGGFVCFGSVITGPGLVPVCATGAVVAMAGVGVGVGLIYGATTEWHHGSGH
jgi:RHS repeat-associated protein